MGLRERFRLEKIEGEKLLKMSRPPRKLAVEISTEQEEVVQKELHDAETSD